MVSILPADLSELLGLSSAAVFLLDRVGQVLYASPAANHLLTQLRMLSIRDGVLTARRKGEDREIRDALASLSPQHPDGTVCLRSREGFPIILMDLRLLASGRIAARLTDLTARPVPSFERLRHVLGLTPAESRVASAMLAGLGLSAIASKNGVEPETVRSQAKRIRAKAGAHSQNQLLSILAAMGAGLGSAD